MPVIHLKLEDAGDFFGRRVSKAIRDGASRGLLSAAIRAVSDIKVHIIPQLVPEPTDRGHYKAGWDFGEDDEGGAWYGNNLPHAAFIEYGVRAGNVKVSRAMIDSLAEWVQRKGLGQGLIARKIAWAIATQMKMRGIFNGGKGFGVMAEMNKRLPKIIEDEVARETERALGKA